MPIMRALGDGSRRHRNSKPASTTTNSWPAWAAGDDTLLSLIRDTFELMCAYVYLKYPFSH
ncbi:hypothetical protein U0070_027042 [Myodes glareolus]|uniref:Uncharacterized protein n=1 Tax=Myodes glareolus TaxID=447135 RepID=A0AAW0IIN2_MYOGA